ncbi:unnamed protein product, partial [Prorocentrum cordatum]
MPSAAAPSFSPRSSGSSFSSALSSRASGTSHVFRSVREVEDQQRPWAALAESLELAAAAPLETRRHERAAFQTEGAASRTARSGERHGPRQQRAARWTPCSPPCREERRQRMRRRGRLCSGATAAMYRSGIQAVRPFSQNGRTNSAGGAPGARRTDLAQTGVVLLSLAAEHARVGRLAMVQNGTPAPQPQRSRRRRRELRS